MQSFCISITGASQSFAKIYLYFRQHDISKLESNHSGKKNASNHAREIISFFNQLFKSSTPSNSTNIFMSYQIKISYTVDPDLSLKMCLSVH